MKYFAYITAACVAAALSASSTTGSGLRQMRRGLSDPPGTPKHCKGLVGNPSNQDRYCEPNAISTNPDNCGCREQCHVWGDPHVESFLTGCDMLSLKAEAWYSLFYTGKDQTNRNKVQISAYAEDLSGRNKGYWVSKLYLESFSQTGMILDVDMCNANPNTRIPIDIEVTPTGYTNSVTIRVLAYCDQKGSAPMHVNTFITVIDNCVPETENSDDGSDDVPSSVKMFTEGGGSGICVNPCNNDVMKVGAAGAEKPDSFPDRDMSMDSNGEKECKSGKKWVWDLEFGKGSCKRRPGSIDGRTCSFTATCSAHGDPYLTNFYEEMLTDNSKMCKQTGKNKQCTQVFPKEVADDADPADQQEAMQSREMYMVPGSFQAEVYTDDCHLITKYIAHYKVGKKIYTAEYNAADLCPLYDADGNYYTAGSTGVMFQAPSESPSGVKHIDNVNKKVYDAWTGGFTLPTVQNDDGSETEGGVVAVNLKCHITNPKGDNPPRLYFNTCVERYDGQSLAGGDFILDGDYKTLEKSMLTRGWCATGDIVSEERSINGDSVTFDFVEVGTDYTSYSEECQLGSTKCQ